MMSEGMATIDGLRDVLVAPDLRPAGLASVAQLLDNSRPGSGVLFTRTGAYFGVFACDGATAISSRRGGLYMTDPATIAKYQVSSNFASCNLSHTAHRNRCLIRHARLGHVNLKRLKRMRDSSRHSEIKFSDT